MNIFTFLHGTSAYIAWARLVVATKERGPIKLKDSYTYVKDERAIPSRWFPYCAECWFNTSDLCNAQITFNKVLSRFEMGFPIHPADEFPEKESETISTDDIDFFEIGGGGMNLTDAMEKIKTLQSAMQDAGCLTIAQLQYIINGGTHELHDYDIWRDHIESLDRVKVWDRGYGYLIAFPRKLVKRLGAKGETK